MSKIIRGYWNCEYCGNKDIDGLVDNCPGCGRKKPAHTKCHLKNGVQTNKIYKSSQISKNDYVLEEELKNAGISKEECNGNHKDWICEYCDSLNNWSDKTCTSCGSSKEESELEYGMTKNENYDKYQNSYTEQNNETENNNLKTEESFLNYQSADNSYIMEDHQEKPMNKIKSWVGEYSNVLLTSFFSICFILLALVLFFPHDEIVTVTGFSWERNISLEEYRTVDESGWTVPSGGRVYDEKQEIRYYTPVIDHYETRIETKSRQVIDYYETDYSYSDNGNGTFTENTEQVPVYKTEYYTETYEEPVYRQDPVYDTKYYYEIERWIETGEDFRSSGQDQNPYWNELYLPLADNLRDTDRWEEYTVYYNNNTNSDKSYSEWITMNVGDELIQKKCLLGIVYSEKYISIE